MILGGMAPAGCRPTTPPISDPAEDGCIDDQEDHQKDVTRDPSEHVVAVVGVRVRTRLRRRSRSSPCSYAGRWRYSGCAFGMMAAITPDAGTEVAPTPSRRWIKASISTFTGFIRAPGIGALRDACGRGPSRERRRSRSRGRQGVRRLTPTARRRSRCRHSYEDGPPTTSRR